MPIPGIQNDAIRGFTNVNDLSNMIQVLDSDPASAEAINRGAAAWEQHFAHNFGLTGDPELGRHAGQLTQAVHTADNAELDAFRANSNWDALRSYHDRSAHWDTTKEILNDAAGFIPGGKAVSLVQDLANLAAGEAKDDILGLPADPTKLSDTAWAKALDNTSTLFTQLVDGHYRQFNIVQGYLDGHPSALAQFQNFTTADGRIVNFVDPNGKLNWNAVVRNQDDFDRLYERLSLANDPSVHLGQVWDSKEHGYQSGLTDLTIGPLPLSAPEDARHPPTR